MMARWVGAIAGGLLVAVWLGYPAVMWLRARWRPAPLRPDPHRGASRHVTVILATRAHPAAVAARVENLCATAHPANRLDIVVAWDGDPAPDTIAALERALEIDRGGTSLRVVCADAPGGKASALNAGVRAARGERLVFADTAQRFEATTIPALVAALEDDRFGAVSGVLHLADDASPLRAYWVLERFLRRQEALVHASIGVTGAVYAMPRALWTPLPDGTLLDDVWVPMQLVLRGHRIGVAVEAQAWDDRAFDAKDEVVRKTRTQTGVLQLLALLPGLLSSANPVRWAFVWHKLARLLSPLLLAVMLVAGVIDVVPALAREWPSWRIWAAVLVAMVVVIAPVRRQAITTIRYATAMQWALVRAVVLAARGRWGVWHPTGE